MSEGKKMNTEIKTCPFCGNKKDYMETIRDGLRVSCSHCGGSGPNTYHGPDGDTEERAIRAWNERSH